jgi:hypothetical protein
VARQRGFPLDNAPNCSAESAEGMRQPDQHDPAERGIDADDQAARGGLPG